MEYTIYDFLVEKMSKDFIKIPSKINENEIEYSKDDECIYIASYDCDLITIRGIRESRIRNFLLNKPHRIFIKLYDYNRIEALPNDTVRFSIIETNKLPESVKHTIFYNYPYSLLSGKKFLGLKKGIVITKEKKLEIKFIRNSEIIKIGKLEFILECDKWIKK